MPGGDKFYPLTRVSKADDPDLVLLALERDEAWEAMRHHEQRANGAVRDLKSELRFRKRLQVKAQAFDILDRVIAEGSSFKDLSDALHTLGEVIAEANRKFDALLKYEIDVGEE